MGIDPGFKGAIALIDAADKAKPKLIELWDMPVFKTVTRHANGSEKTTHQHIDMDLLNIRLTKYAHKIERCIIEEVGVMTGVEGRVSMFNFGRGFGQVEGIVKSFMIPISYVKPAVWKSSLGLSRDKMASRELAEKHFPTEMHRLTRKIDDGKAEALLLAMLACRLI